MSLHSTTRELGPLAPSVDSTIAFGFGCTRSAVACSSQRLASFSGSAGSGSGRRWAVKAFMKRC